jgi:hypothetical protein
VEHGVAFTIATDGPEMMRTHLRDELDLLFVFDNDPPDNEPRIFPAQKRPEPLPRACSRSYAASDCGPFGRVENVSLQSSSVSPSIVSCHT